MYCCCSPFLGKTILVQIHSLSDIYRRVPVHATEVAELLEQVAELLEDAHLTLIALHIIYTYMIG